METRRAEKPLLACLENLEELGVRESELLCCVVERPLYGDVGRRSERREAGAGRHDLVGEGVAVRHQSRRLDVAERVQVGADVRERVLHAGIDAELMGRLGRGERGGRPVGAPPLGGKPGLKMHQCDRVTRRERSGQPLLALGVPVDRHDPARARPAT